MSGTYVYDIEVYPNFFYALFEDLESGEHTAFTIDDIPRLNKFVDGAILIGFNSKNYDSVIIRALFDGEATSLDDVYKLSKAIVEEKYRPKTVWQKNPWWDIDLSVVHNAYAREWSLKRHQVRMRWSNVQDLPYDPHTSLTPDQIEELKTYCGNDVQSTVALYHDFNDAGIFEVLEEVQNEYPFLANKASWMSQARIGEEVIKTLYVQSTGVKRHTLKNIKPDSIIFDPSTMIDPNISFFTDHNNKVLEHIRSIPPENMYNKAPNEWAKKHLDGSTFKIGEEHIPVGVGGLHTTRPQGQWTGRIVDFDVTSYYPQLILNMDRSPAGLSAAWLDEFRKPYEQRIAYKQKGNKAGADVMKIVINSVYGKLGQGTSINYDPSLQMSVTLNGQLFLAMLIEAFVGTGYELISANTDGVTILIPPNREDDTRDIVEWWEAISRCKLETTEYTQYVSQSVNNYFAVTKDGHVKRKGFFLADTGTDPAIIPEAVIKHFTENVPVEETINNATSIFDFLYSANLKGHIQWCGETLSKTNRWYISSNGSPITIGTDKPRQAPNSQNAWVCNLIIDDAIPDDLIKDRYIAEAKKAIYGIESGLNSTSKKEGVLKHQAKKFIDQEMHIVPKGRPNQPKANLPGRIPTKPAEVKPIDDYPWWQYNGFGAVTGEAFGIIAIDIDEPNLAAQAGLHKHLQKSKNHLTAFHGTTSADVFAGASRGTILYRYDGNALRSTNHQFAQNFGFELLYGRNVVQLRGVHSSGEPYETKGTLKDIPPKLLDYLTKLTAQGNYFTKTNEEREPVDPSTIEIDEEVAEKLLTFSNAAEKDQLHENVGPFDVEISQINHKPQLVGRCPYNHVDDRTRSFSVQWTGSRFHGLCPHQKCRDTIREYVERVSERVSPCVSEQAPDPISKVETLQPLTHRTQESPSIAEALRNPATHRLITAGTGGGKTYNAVHWACELIKDTDDKIILIVPDKAAMIQCAEEFYKILDDNPSKYGVDLVCSQSDQLQYNELERVSSPRENARCVVTHFTYMARKGASKYSYVLTNWIDSNTRVIVDEIDEYIEANTLRLPFGRRGLEADGQIQWIERCPLAAGRGGDCRNCVMHTQQGFVYRKRTGVYELEPRAYYQPGDQVVGLPIIPYEHLVTHAVEIQEIRAEQIKSLPYNEVRDLIVEDPNSENARPTYFTYAEDVLEQGCNGTMWHPVIRDKNGNVVDRQKVIDVVTNHTDFTIANKPFSEVAKKHFEFPFQSCNVKRYVTVDRIMFKQFNDAKSFTTLSATIDDHKLKFLFDHVSNLAHFDIPADQSRKIDTVYVICTPVQLISTAFKKIINDSESDNLDLPMLIFKPSKAKANSLFDELKGIDANLRLAKGVNEIEGLVDFDNDLNAYNRIITHSLGSLGRGMNLGRFKHVFVDSQVYKPMFAYSVKNEEELAEAHANTRTTVVKQNIGRVMRTTDDEENSYRVIVVHNCDTHEDAESLTAQLAELANNVQFEYLEKLSGGEVAARIVKLAEVTAKGERPNLEQLLLPNEDEKLKKQIARLKKRIIELAAEEKHKWFYVKKMVNYAKKSDDLKQWIDVEGKALFESNMGTI